MIKYREERFYKIIERRDKEIRKLDISEEKREKLLELLDETCERENNLERYERENRINTGDYGESLEIIRYNFIRSSRSFGRIAGCSQSIQSRKP